MNTVSSFLTEAINRIAELSPQLDSEVQPIREILNSPPRIAIVGRIKAGKSTLTNALIGAPKAETAALEATSVVTAYHYGYSDRAAITLRDGRKTEWQVRHDMNNQPPVAESQIAYIDRWMSIAALKQFSLIDTPGLATTTRENEQRTRNALIDGYGDLNVDADGAVFLFESVPKRDEIAFIHDLGFTPLNTLGVLSRADSFGEGALGKEDPFDVAAAFAKRLQRQLSDVMLDVVPVSGLMAETALTGALTEEIAREIDRVSKFDRTEILSVLIGNQNVSELNKEALVRIVDLITEYGVFCGARFAGAGAAPFNSWLMEKSGVTTLKNLMATSLGNYATLHRASRTISELEQLALRNYEYQGEIRNIISTAISSRDMLPARLFGSLKALQTNHSSKFVIEAVTRMLAETSTATRIGLPADANKFQILDRLHENQRKLRRLSLTCNPAEETAIPILLTAYEDLEKPEHSWL